MKIRKRHRTGVMKSERHGKRRAKRPEWIKACEANPLNRMSNRQVTAFQRLESALLAKKRKDGVRIPKITPAENERLLAAARLA